MKVQLFITCLAEQFFPSTLENMVRILEDHHVDVEFPESQTCCGQPFFNSGFQNEARQLASNWMRTFYSSEGFIVAPSGSCVDMVRHHYPNLFPIGTEEHEIASDLANRTFEFCEFLVNKMHLVDLGARFPHRVSYHASCHLLRGLGIRNEAKLLLQAVDSLDLVPLPEEEVCCGFGGVFSVIYPEISESMMERKLTNIIASGADFVTAGDAGCLMNIGGGLLKRNSTIRVKHIIDILGSQE